MHKGVILLAAAVLVVTGEVCYSDAINQPIIEKDGDYIIAGVFNAGTLVESINP